MLLALLVTMTGALYWFKDSTNDSNVSVYIILCLVFLTQAFKITILMFIELSSKNAVIMLITKMSCIFRNHSLQGFFGH